MLVKKGRILLGDGKTANRKKSGYDHPLKKNFFIGTSRHKTIKPRVQRAHIVNCNNVAFKFC